MSKLKLNVKGKRVTQQFAKISYDIGLIAVRYTKEEVFRNEAWDGVPWKPRGKDYPHKPLQKTGRMRNSIRILQYSSKGVKWGSRVSYAKYHNAGTSKIPKRKFIGIDRVLARRIKPIIARRIKQAMKG